MLCDGWKQLREGRTWPTIPHPSPGGEGGEEGLEGLSRGQAVQETPSHRHKAASGDFAIVFIVFSLWKALVIDR